MAAPPRVAIAISGAYRTLTDCNDTIARYVIDANPSVHFEVFAALTADPATDAERQKMEEAVRFGRACIASVQIESNAAVTAAVRRDMPALENHPPGHGTARGQAPNIVKMFRGIGRAWQLIEEHVAMQDASCSNATPARMRSGGSAKAGSLGTARASSMTAMPPADAAMMSSRVGSRYDLVLRLRPDLCFCAPLDLSAALASPGSWWLPWADRHAHLAFDQIAAGSAAMMSIYSKAYHATAVTEVQAGKELYPESVMWRHLASQSAGGGGGGAPRISLLAGFRASLARHRPNGVAQYDDSFGKLKQDLYGFLSHPGLAAGLPTHLCRGQGRGGRLGGGAGMLPTRGNAAADAARSQCMDAPCRKAERRARKADAKAERAARRGEGLVVEG